MDLKLVKELVEQGLSSYKIAEKIGIPRGTLVYRMKVAGISTAKRQHAVKAHRCTECGETDPTKFYKKQKQQCTSCHTKQVNKRHADTRQKGIDHLGGKCSSCGYDKCNKALEFHHLDPSVKDSSFKTSRGWSVSRLLSELDKCVLLCANCHREEHDKLSKAQSSSG